MSDKPLAQKLQLKADRSVLLVDPPPGYNALLGPLPAGVTIVTEPVDAVDVIQVFVHSRAELEAQLERLRALLKPKGLLWVCWPKGTSTIKTDVNRDSIAAYAQTLGLAPVASVAVDQDWSALRFKLV